jgi:hypothetical protein
MANTLPLLRPVDIDWGKNKLDDLVKLKSPVAEAFDGPLAHLFLTYGNKLASPHIPDEFKDEIYAVLDQVEEGDSSDAAQKAIDLFDVLQQSLVHLAPAVKEIVSAVLGVIKGVLLTVIPAKV